MSRLIFSGALTLCVLIAACGSRGSVDLDDPGFVPPAQEVQEEQSDLPVQCRAQSDFLELGEAANLEWLSFVPHLEHRFPELLDTIEQRKLQLHLLLPRHVGEQQLLHLDLNESAIVDLVDWNGLTLIEINYPRVEDFPKYRVTLAIAKDNGECLATIGMLLGERRAALLETQTDLEVCSSTLATWRDDLSGDKPLAGVVGLPTYVWSDCIQHYDHLFAYSARRLTGTESSFLLIAEFGSTPMSADSSRDLPTFTGASILRDASLINRDSSDNGLAHEGATEEWE